MGFPKRKGGAILGWERVLYAVSVLRVFGDLDW